MNKVILQKGCINFDNEDKMPPEIVQQLIAGRSTIDLIKIKEDYLKQKNKIKALK